MMQNFLRSAIALGVGAVVATGLVLQAASSVSERRAPDLAVTLNPFNGMAREQATFARFSKAASDPSEVDRAASQARLAALLSYQSEPLVPKSLTILALSTSDKAQRAKLLDIASRLNRRDLALQVAVLESRLGRADAVGAIATLDQLLRVRPELSQQFFPPLQQALLNPETENTFAKLLDGSSPWHNSFAVNATGDPAARVRLAKIRSRINIDHSEFDPRLISGLAAQGEFALASELYKQVAKPTDKVEKGVTRLSWRGDFPPFEWEYVDQKDIRAKPSATGEKLEVFARPGEGATIAKRTVALPAEARGLLSFKIDSTRPIIDGRMRMSVYCNTSPTPLVERDLATGENVLAFSANGDDCGLVRIEIFARTSRGEPVLRAGIGQINIR